MSAAKTTEHELKVTAVKDVGGCSCMLMTILALLSHELIV